MPILSRSVHSYILNGILRMTVRRKFRKGVELQKLRRMMGKEQPQKKPPSEVSMRHGTLAGREARWFQHEQASGRDIILYLHGGAFILSTPSFHSGFLLEFLRHNPMQAVMPEYRLAPEHPFPAAVEDSLEAYEALLKQGYEPQNIVVMGDSAGGNLSLVLLQELKRLHRPLPSCALLLSPVTDLSGSSPSIRENATKDPLFHLDALPMVSELYFGADESLVEDPRLSPVYGGFEGLPPLYFVAGSTELIRDDSVRAAEKARAAGVTVECRIWEGLAHVFPLMVMLPEAQVANQQMSVFLQTHLGTSPS